MQPALNQARCRNDSGNIKARAARRHKVIKASGLWLVFSAMAWAIAAVAYPSLLLGFGVLFACFFIVISPTRPMLLTYAGLVMGFPGGGVVFCDLAPHMVPYTRHSIVSE